MSNLATKVRQFYEDDQMLFESLAETVEWHETEGLPYGGVYKGKEETMQGVFSHIMADWEDFSAKADQVLPVGRDKVLTTGRYDAVYKATGKHMNATFAHLYTFANGKVVKFQQFGDSAKFAEAMS